MLTVLVGGGSRGGIHGSHLGPGVEIRYAAADAKRQVIPWVEYKNSQKGESRTYLGETAKAEEVAALPKYTMQCVDCHNRPTHAFDSPEGAVDKALAGGRLPSSLPYIKKKSVEILKGELREQRRGRAGRSRPPSRTTTNKPHPDVYAGARGGHRGRRTARWPPSTPGTSSPT